MKGVNDCDDNDDPSVAFRTPLYVCFPFLLFSAENGDCVKEQPNAVSPTVRSGKSTGLWQHATRKFVNVKPNPFFKCLFGQNGGLPFSREV